MRTFLAVSSLAFLASAPFGQSEPRPSFEVADVHASTPSITPGMRGPLRQGDRWELKNATMADLIAFAYGVEADKVLEGPNWLEFDRFDVIAKAAPNTPAETLRTMLQSLLADRFKLVLHTDTRPFPGWALTAGKNPRLKDSDGSGQPGCGFRVSMSAPVDASAGARPIQTLTASCHNSNMEAFANFIRRWISSPNSKSVVKIVDKTELNGTYDFDLQFSPTDSQAVILSAIDKQLGLKLEPIQIPTQVILVEAVNRKPTPNAPNTLTVFPPPPTEFEAASLKPSPPLDAGPGGGRGRGGAGVYQGTRLTRQNATLTQLIYTAWNIYNPDLIVGLPKFSDADHYDLMATVPHSIATPEGGSRDQVDLDLYRPMYQKLLTERFQMKFHFEDRPVNTWVLTAVKPKLQKADPSSRTKWTEGPAPGEKDLSKSNPALNRLVNCRNMTMAEFAALLPSIAAENQTVQVRDETGLQGSWDFSLTFSGFGYDRAGAGVAFVARGGDAGASDPSGAITLVDAISKQLGLKLELKKRPAPVLVIDHMEQKPADN